MGVIGTRRKAILAVLSLLLITSTPALIAAQASHETGAMEVSASQLPTARSRAAAVGLDGATYVIGGNDGTDLDQILRYESASDSVTVLPWKMPSGRYGASATTSGSSVIVLGGAIGTSYLDEIVVIDTASGSVEIAPARLPSPRAFASAVTIGPAVYVLGGLGPAGPLDEVVRFDIAAGSVSLMGARLPTPLFDASSVADGATAYIFGGFDNRTLHSRILKYDPVVDAVSVAAAELPSARDQTSAVWNGANAYVFAGGTGVSLLREIVRYDPASEEISIMGEKLPGARDQTAAAWDGRTAVLIGGFDGVHPTGEIVKYDPANRAPRPQFTFSTARLVVSVDASASVDADGRIASYEWNWGDGSEKASGVRTSHEFAAAGSYVVTLTVTDDGGATARRTATVEVATVNMLPLASFVHTSRALTATFNASASRDTDGRISTYEWSFGDGQPGASGVEATRAFPSGGSYAVTLTVTDDEGGSASLVRAIEVSESNLSPTAAFTAVVDGLMVTLDARASFDPDGRIVSYAWNWSDGTPDSGGRSTAHKFASAGSYVVTLVVTDDSGAFAVESETVTVEGVDNGFGGSDAAPIFALLGFALEPEKPTRGTTVVAKLTLSNQGNATGVATARLRVNDTVHDVRLVTVPPGETTVVRFKEVRLDGPGPYRFQAGTVGGLLSAPILVSFAAESAGADGGDRGLESSIPGPSPVLLMAAAAIASLFVGLFRDRARRPPRRGHL